ncbi:MAG: T9SS type A sorting domain-containing protein [Bacteroidia bacterium]|nr:T9SS type A sorting domain-containing protein [Bacteroidota bacterium]MBP6512603.1 T9SS type A sorting domain-containing protein [Bacteroidia bacterium]MBP7244938.1 T9SS type A sorting domain-containing protein [Bacteroidia bacterium]
MKHSFITIMLLLLFSALQAQQPCSPNELVSISKQLDSPCEALFSTSSYFNFATLTAQRNNIRTGTLEWQFRSDTVNGTWQPISASWLGQGTEFIDKPDFTTADNGQYRCVFTDTATGCKDYRRTSVYVYPRPDYNINVDHVGCVAMYLSTPLLNDPNQVLSHCWQPDFGTNPIVCESNSPLYAFQGVGCAMVVGTVTAIVTNQYGCENLSFVSGLCNLEYLDTYASLNAPDTIFCAKSGSIEVMRFSNTSVQSGWTYQWLKNGNPLSWATNNIIKPTTTGKYKCMVTNNSGCTAITNEISVTVNKLPTVNLQPSGITEICNKDTIVMSSGSHTSNTFEWYRNGQLLLQNTVAIGVSKNGNYKVLVTSPEGCSATSPISKINIYRSTIEATGPVVICTGDSSVLQNLTPNTVARQWQLNNVNIPGATSAQYAAMQSGLYRVKSTSAGGCISYSNQIDISVNCREALEENYLLHISPVPSSQFINLGSFETTGNFRINITDMNGKIVFENNDSQFDIHQLDVSGLAAGMYIIHFSDEAGKRSGKFIRE